MKYDHLLFDLDNTILDFTSAMIFAASQNLSEINFYDFSLV